MRMQMRRSEIQLGLGDRQIYPQPRAVGKKFHLSGLRRAQESRLLIGLDGYSTRIQISIANEETRRPATISSSS